MKTFLVTILFAFIALVPIDLANAQNAFCFYDKPDSLFLAFANGTYVPVLRSRSSLKTRIDWDANKNIDSVYRMGAYTYTDEDTVFGGNRYKVIFKYDSLEQIMSYIYFQFDADKNRWEERQQYKEYYNAKQEVLEMHTFNFDTLTQTWVPYSANTKSCSETDTVSVYKSYDSKSMQWTNSNKYAIYYANAMKTSEYYNWNDDSSQWLVWSIERKKYNEYNDLIEKTTIDRNSEDEQLDTSYQRFEITYDAEGNHIAEKEFRENRIYRTVFHYDLNEQGQPRMSIDSMWNNKVNKFTARYKYLYSYTPDGRQDTLLLYWWLPEKQMFYHYGTLATMYNSNSQLLNEKYSTFNEEGDTMHCDTYVLAYNKQGEITYEKYGNWNFGNANNNVAFENYFFFPIRQESISYSNGNIAVVFDDYLLPGDYTDAVQIQGSLSVYVAEASVSQTSPDNLVIKLNKYPDDGEYVQLSATPELLTADGRHASFYIELGNDPDVHAEQARTCGISGTLYPAVCNETLYLHSSEPILSWNIISASAAIVLSGGDIHSSYFTISVHSLNAGSYILTAIGDQGNTVTLPFVKK